jgi:hypothetical protein
MFGRLLRSIHERMIGVSEAEVRAILEGEAEIERGEYVVMAQPSQTVTTASGTSVNLIARFP